MVVPRNAIPAGNPLTNDTSHHDPADKIAARTHPERTRGVGGPAADAISQRPRHDPAPCVMCEQIPHGGQGARGRRNQMPTTAQTPPCFVPL
jgi:hypothetical protein